MKKYAINIISNNLINAIALKKIIDDYCMELIDVSYFLTLEEGIKNIKKSIPEIIFIDAKYRDNEMFDFLKLIELNGVSVIFISTEVSITLDSFKKNIDDFILCPFISEDVILSINKVLNTFGKSNITIETKRNEYDSIAIASLDKIDFIETKDILFCMADGKYTYFYMSNGNKIVSSKNLGEYEKILNDLLFFRVHHGYIVNIKYLTSIIKKDGAYCQLINNIKIPIAKRKQGDFNRFIKIKS